MATVDVTDQRRTKRYELRLPFELVRAGERRLHEVGETKNLSSGGVLFITTQPLEIGDPVEYFITLPSRRGNRHGVRLHCVGKVVRFHGEGPRTIAATLERYEFVRSLN